MEQLKKRVAVIGGGLTGLTAAWRLHSQGHRVRLFEASGRLGGAVRTGRIDDWLVEAGPNSLQFNSSETAAVFDQLGLTARQIPASPAARNRYVVCRGKLCAMPMSPGSLISTPLFSAKAKFGLLGELFQKKRERPADVSLAEFVRDHFGPEFVSHALDPFVTGVYAGDAEKLSAHHTFPKLWELERTQGSIIRGQIAQARERKARGEPKSKLISFPEGLQTLTDALAQALPSGAIELHAEITSLLPGPAWKLGWRRDGVTCTEEADAVVLALPAAGLAALRVGASGDQPLAALGEIPHSPVTSLFLGFRREDVAHPLDGFGALAPSSERRSVLGVLFSSTLFPGRAPAGHVALTVMVGGVRRPELAALPPEEIFAALQTDLRELLGVTAAPVFMRHTHWPRAIPQYNLGYGRFLEAMTAVETAHSGLFIGGQVRDGVGLGACLSAGLRLAGAAAAF